MISKERKYNFQKEEVSPQIIKAHLPNKSELLSMRLLITLAILSMIAFLWWFIDPDHIGYPPLYWLLTCALAFKLLRMLHEWYHYFSITVPKRPKTTKDYKVDIFTTFCPGEPYSMILETLEAIQKITYPHTAYLCDEGNDPYLKQVCEDLGVVHVTRTIKIDAKAGNINNALKGASGDICVILDPDHVPVPEFLDRVLPYFEDPEVGFVQVVQAYSNRLESLVAKGAAEQTYSFYGPLMMSMSGYGTAQAIGANCTFRREALDSIGGHAAGLSEDMHTSMKIHAKGWKSLYVPEILSRGLVPATLAGYYKQQLKWSRGTFDLLFYVYPKLFKLFTWRQKIHYFTVPLYYLYGVFGLVDILIPVISLLTAQAPWLVNIAEFTLMFLPMFILSLLIRQYSQRWLLEKHERGFHMIGGILRMGTWWIFTVGFVYTIFKIKVPYIPTPKDDKPQNNFILTLPNIMACLVSIGAIIYGLSIDWNPYSFLMAGFALTNILILGFIVILGQEKFILQVKNRLERFFPIGNYIHQSKVVFWNIRHPFYNFIRNGAVLYALLMLLLLFGFIMLEKNQEVKLKSLAPPDMKNTGGFYTGIYLPSLDSALSFAPVKTMSQTMNTSFDIVSFYQAWGPESLEKFPDSLLHQTNKQGGVPMITWEPWTSTFPEHASHPELSMDRKVFKGINEGLFDDYIKAYALKLRNFGEPVFLRFAHEPDNPSYAWSPSGGNTPGEYIEAWQYVVKLFVKQGVSNVTWVWNPWSHKAIEAYFPGGKYVDWVGITSLNYGLASSDSKWYTFEELYKPYQHKLLSLQRPIMLAEFGSTSYGGDQDKWISESLKGIQKKHSEIKALVFFYNDKDKNWATNWRPNKESKYIDWTFKEPQKTMQKVRDNLTASAYKEKPFFNNTFITSNTNASIPDKAKLVRGERGKFELLVDEKPFYIKGVAYNPAHDWRDGFLPLTRRQLEKDFLAIKAMGANTIRRYNPSIYDKNVLTIATEQDLKVLYGFWFDPEIDYYRDSIQVNKYIKEVETTVEKYKDYKAVLAWSVGNEAWGLLKHHYSQPYLTKVREAYAKMIERMAQRIHQIDPDRPVLTAAEHAIQLPGELHAFHKHAPSLDLIGINSYYWQQIIELDQLTTQFDSTRPYIVSEFGPRGYWDPDYTVFQNDTILIEDSNYEKAIWYTWQWNTYVKENQGKNVGGFAFSWRDRLEGTATWFGLTDFKGRKKPAYHALRKEWTQEKPSHRLHDVFISLPSGSLRPGETYEISAITENKLWQGIKYEWFLRREEYLGYEGSLATKEEGKKVRVTIPEEPSKYRLYLYVSDKHGNVVTATAPLPVKWD